MPVKPITLQRVFRYNGQDIPDPNPDLPTDKVLETLADAYPELINATVTKTKIEGASRIHTVEAAVGTKG